MITPEYSATGSYEFAPVWRCGWFFSLNRKETLQNVPGCLIRTTCSNLACRSGPGGALLRRLPRS